MSKPTDIRVVATELYFLPVRTRVPLKFGPQTLTSVTCARVKVTVADASGRRADGWGETPLSVQWVWPSGLSYDERHDALKSFCELLAEAWTQHDAPGHAMELGFAFIETKLPGLLQAFNEKRREDAGGGKEAGSRSAAGRRSDPSPLRGRLGGGDERGEVRSRPESQAETNTQLKGGGPESEPTLNAEPMPHLAALVCLSAFDIATHDAFGKLHGKSTYDTYNAEFMSLDLASMLKPAEDADVSFAGQYPCDYLVAQRPNSLPAWHLVGGLDLLDDAERTGDEPDDGYPVTLPEWLKRDGVNCLKVKLRGDDAEWDFDRLTRVADIADAHHPAGWTWLSADFNCTVTDPAYVNAILDRLRDEQPRTAGMILYVEQPFPYELETHRIDVHSVSARKPLFMDESAHDWRLVRLGRSLGWTGVALKTCKTQSGALLSACWAKAHGMTLMVQDLTNPMLAQIPHVLLAAHTHTIMGVETNAMQFYPEASNAEAKVHPGLYRRRDGRVDLSTIEGPGFGYRVDEIERELPAAAMRFEM